MRAQVRGGDRGSLLADSTVPECSISSCPRAQRGSASSRRDPRAEVSLAKRPSDKTCLFLLLVTQWRDAWQGWVGSHGSSAQILMLQNVGMEMEQS